MEKELPPDLEDEANLLIASPFPLTPDQRLALLKLSGVEVPYEPNLPEGKPIC